MYYTTLTLTLGEILSHRQPSEVTDTFLKGLNLKPSHLFKVIKLETQASLGSNRPGRGRGGRGGRGGETARSPSPEAKRSRRQRGRPGGTTALIAAKQRSEHSNKNWPSCNGHSETSQRKKLPATTTRGSTVLTRPETSRNSWPGSML